MENYELSVNNIMDTLNTDTTDSDTEYDEMINDKINNHQLMSSDSNLIDGLNNLNLPYIDDMIIDHRDCSADTLLNSLDCFYYHNIIMSFI